MTRLRSQAGAVPAAFLAACAIPGMPRVALDKPSEGGGADFTTLTADLKKATDEVKTFAEKAEAEIKNLGKVTDETKANADKALAEMGGLTARIGDLEQKLARRGAPAGGEEHKSVGRIVAESEAVKAAGQRGDAWKGSLAIEVKAITAASASGTSASTALVPADRVAGTSLPRRPMTIRALLQPGRTNSSIIEYARQTVRTPAGCSTASATAATATSTSSRPGPTGTAPTTP
ncbi:hypothetical protein ABIE45_004421 [Methylobacterium sp. OAE515]|uniref:hypothetical protein n=1 Tax=Methylobacterium sp. OAE515 TaxID=2817895 RepID=UPI0017890088